MKPAQKYGSPFQITILVLPECSMMCVASVVEPFRAANRVYGQKIYEWRFVSLSGLAVAMTCGLRCDVEGEFNHQEKGDLLVVIAGFNQDIHAGPLALSRIRMAASSFSLVAGIEAGSWILARAGLLSGRSATTHWEDFEAFTSAFADIDVKLDRYVVSGDRMTCGGASPAFDMFLDLVGQQHGTAVAMEVASVFIYDESHSRLDAQPVVSLGRVARREPRLEQAIRLMEKSAEQPLPVAAIARRTGVSIATLESIFKRHTGLTPGRFYLNLRLKIANRLVMDSGLPMREIAVRSGFNSLSAFSRAYAVRFGSPPSSMRSNSV